VKKVSTILRLDPLKLKALKRLAVDRDLSLSRLLQEIIDRYLVQAEAMAGKDCRTDPFFLIGKRPARSGKFKISEEHDRFLYR
jgi:hypothetical protein